jgi:hypothetical protein
LCTEPATSSGTVIQNVALMACCVVAALMVGVLYRLLPFLRPHYVEAPFAPVASRVAPTASAGEGPQPATQPREPVSVDLPVTVVLLRAAAVGALGYLVASGVLLALGVAVLAASPVLLAVHAVIVMLAATALVLVAHRRAPARAVPQRGALGVGLALIGTGIAWLELLEADMHLLGLFEIPDVAAHDLAHFVGLAAVGTGAAALVWVRGRPGTVVGG